MSTQDTCTASRRQALIWSSIVVGFGTLSLAAVNGYSALFYPKPSRVDAVLAIGLLFVAVALFNLVVSSRRMLIGLAALPIVATVTFYSFVAAWRLRLGYWPTYARPDAGAFHGLALIPDVALTIVLAASAASIVPTGVVILLFAVHRGRAPWRPAGVAVLAWIAFVALFRADPGAYLDWFLD